MKKRIKLYLPIKLHFLLNKKIRFKIVPGGRSSGKSWAIAEALILIAYTRETRILCTREHQASIKHSVHRLLTDTIRRLGLQRFFDVTENSIMSHNGSEFFFFGLRRNIEDIRSTEGIDIVWIEEAAKATSRSLEILDPTIRKEGSEIWMSFNPDFPSDEVYKTFVIDPPEDAMVVKMTYKDNLYLSNTSLATMNALKKKDYQKYLHVWEGEVRSISDSVIFKDKFIVEDFEFKDISQFFMQRYFFGIDWGFGLTHPTVLIRCFVKDDCLYIDHESYVIKSELTGKKIVDKSMINLMLKIPESKRWKIQADHERPESIRFVQRLGFDIVPAPKWKGSVEDGIEYIKGFDKVIIHERCKKTLFEFNNYKYKVDTNTEEIFRIPVKEHDHCIDAIRYALSRYIQKDVSMLDVIDDDDD